MRAQRGAEVDVWVWVHPRHRAEIAAMGVQTFTVAIPDVRRPLRMRAPWSSVRGLPRYAVQVLLGSDDLLGPDFVRTALEQLERMPAPRAIVHFQPYKYDLASRRIFDCGISVPRTGEYHYRNDMTSMHLAMRQPVDDPRYSWVWELGHTRLWTLVGQVALVPAGHSLLTVHAWNDTTKVTPADAPLEVEVPWL